MITIKKVGVVGAGTMGAALAQKFAQEGFEVILSDREQKFIDKGISGIHSMLNEGVDKKVFKQEQVDAIIARLKTSVSLSDLKSCDIIIEAIFEDFNAKSELFRNLCEIVSSSVILATNTSSFSVNELADSVKNPERFIGLHYFYHAAKNRLVEIIPGKNTSVNVTEAVYRFSLQSSKDPIFTKDVYGFAVNRFFVPWLNEAVRVVEEGIATIEEVDVVCMNTFGIGMGPFALMNATGVPIALHAQRTLEKLGPFYKPAQLLIQQVGKKENWKINELPASVNNEISDKINHRMLGVVFFVCSQILQEKVCSATDLNKGARIGLKWRKGPVNLLKQFGENKVVKIVGDYAALYKEKIPDSLSDSYWNLEYVTSTIKGKAHVLTFNRPEDLNALNESVVKQLDEKITEAINNPNTDTIIISGSGKAFVAGADIRFFVKNIQSNNLKNIYDFTAYGQSVFEKIDASPKKVVAVLNGLTLGGGLELALCADVILALPNVMMSFPETGIGIYPGLGGTQRAAKKIGLGLAKYLILTGKMLTAQDAYDINLVDDVINSETMFEILNGNIQSPSVTKHALSNKWKVVEDLYGKRSFKSIINKENIPPAIEQKELEKMIQQLIAKAPIAMNIAEELIEKQQGPSSELQQLNKIFSTKDALLGLTSIGKKVVYSGE